MIKLANLKYDLYSDTFHNDLIKIAEAIPDFVKETNLMDKQQLDMLSDGDFALCISTREGDFIRLFPTVDKGHTWLAAYYFLKNQDKLPKEAQIIAATNISKALSYWGVPCPDGIKKIHQLEDDNLQAKIYREKEEDSIPAIEEAQAYKKTASVRTNRYYEKMEDQEKIAYQVAVENEKDAVKAAKDEDFALVVKIAGSTERYFPISTTGLLHESMAQFEQVADGMDPRYRAKVAQTMEKKANELGVTKKSYLIPIYNPRNFSEKLAYHINMRKDLLTDAMQKIALDMMLEKAKNFTPAEFAEKLASFDELTGLDTKWNTLIPDPYFSVAGFVKIGSIEGFDITEDQLRELAQDPKRLEGILEDAMISEFVTRPVEFFGALPKPHQMIIVNMIHGKV